MRLLLPLLTSCVALLLAACSGDAISAREGAAKNGVNEAKAGDIVRIEETRPLSKQKRWALVEKVAAGQA